MLEKLESVAKRFLSDVPKLILGSTLEKLGITKSRRTEYEHAMLQTHVITL